MEIVYIAIPLTLLIVLGAVALFFWAIRNGQFDDLQTPAKRALLDDSPHIDPAFPFSTKPPLANEESRSATREQ